MILFFSFDFLSRIKAKFFYMYVMSHLLKHKGEVAINDINQDTYYTLDSGMKFIIWPWQHNLTSFTHNRSTTVLTTFILHFTLFLYNSILSNLFLFFNYLSLLSFLKVSNLFHVPCNHRFPNSRPFLHKWHFLNCI